MHHMEKVFILDMLKCNKAETGGGVCCSYYSNILIGGSSKITLQDNNPIHGAAMHYGKHCNISFDKDALVRFRGNQGSVGAGIHSEDHCKTIFHGNSFVTFHNNSVRLLGGAVSFNQYSYAIFSVSVKFNNNSALISGGAVYFIQQSHIIFTKNSTVQFNCNKAVLEVLCILDNHRTC